jgi:hypothetical protein
MCRRKFLGLLTGSAVGSPRLATAQSAESRFCVGVLKLLLINRRTAQGLGLTLPPLLLAEGERVIE